jgi:hypothetical protein
MNQWIMYNRPTGALKNQIGAAKQHFISAKSFWRTALKDSVIESLHYKIPGASAFPKKLLGFVVATVAAAQS